MRNVCALLVAALLLPVSTASAQTAVRYVSLERPAVSLDDQDEQALLTDVRGFGTVGIQVTGTFSQTLTPACTVDGSTWVAVKVFPVGSSTGQTTITATGIYAGNIAGCRSFRVRLTADTSGTSVVSLIAHPVGGAGSGGFDTANLATDRTEDAAESDGATGPLALGVRRDAAASSAGASGDYATLNTDSLGQLWARLLDPCSGVAKTPVVVNISTATTTELTASLAGSGNYYYICSINIGPVAGAQNIALVDDDTDNCASVTSGLAGGTTAGTGWNIAANGGLALGNGLGTIARTNGTNRVICAVTSAAVQTSGVLMVVAAP